MGSRAPVIIAWEPERPHAETISEALLSGNLRLCATFYFVEDVVHETKHPRVYSVSCGPILTAPRDSENNHGIP